MSLDLVISRGERDRSFWTGRSRYRDSQRRGQSACPGQSVHFNGRLGKTLPDVATMLCTIRRYHNAPFSCSLLDNALTPARTTYNASKPLAQYPNPYSILLIPRRVLARICLLVIQPCHKPIEARTHDSAQTRPDPVDPMIAFETPRRNTRSETPRRVERCACPVDA